MNPLDFEVTSESKSYFQTAYNGSHIDGRNISDFEQLRRNISGLFICFFFIFEISSYSGTSGIGEPWNARSILSIQNEPLESGKY